jgi:hypothetical protein
MRGDGKVARQAAGRTARLVLAVLVTLVPAWVAAAEKDSKRNGLPAAVLKAIDENKPGALIDKVTVEDEAGVKFYDMEFKGTHGEMDVAMDGTVLDVATIIEVKDLPEPVAEVIRKASAGTTIKQLTRSEVRARVEKVGGKPTVSRLAASEYVYEAELAKGGEVEVAADGRVIKGPKSLGKGSANEK